MRKFIWGSFFTATLGLMFSNPLYALESAKLEVTPLHTVQIKEDEEGAEASYWFTCSETRNPSDVFRKVIEKKPKDSPTYFTARMQQSPFKNGVLNRGTEIDNHIKRCGKKAEDAVKSYNSDKYKTGDRDELKVTASFKKNENIVRVVNAENKAFWIDINTAKAIDAPKEENKKENKTAVADNKKPAKVATKVCLKDVDTNEVFTPKMSAMIWENWVARFVGETPKKPGIEKFYYITAQEDGSFAKGAEICNAAKKKIDKQDEMERLWPSMAGIPTKEGFVARGEDPSGKECEGFERNNLIGKIQAFGVPKADYAETPKEKVKSEGEDVPEPLTRGYYCTYTYGSCGIKTEVVPCGAGAE